MLVLPLLFLAGCTNAPVESIDEPCRPGGASLLGFDDQQKGIASDPRQPLDQFAIVQGDWSLESANVTAPEGWLAEVEPLGQDPNASRVWRIRFVHDTDTFGGPWSASWTLPADANPCQEITDLSVAGRVLGPVPGEVASPGQGVYVYTAGFWENGTLFYTNIGRIDNDTSFPRAGWYESSGHEPLQVYVYDQSRDEVPDQWNACAPEGAPVAECAWEYGTTIEGFNEALKGLSTTTFRVVHLAPEKAYTVDGNEDHVLYGDPLIFFLWITNVVDVPCHESLARSRCDLPVS